MKKLLVVLISGLLLFTLSCESRSVAEGSSSKEITIGRNYDATSLDVQNVEDDGSYLLLYLMGEGLVRNDDGIISPGVAERWDISPDYKTYTFYLRPDAKWSDGSPLTAHDFEYSFKRLINPQFGHKQGYLGLDFLNARAYYNGEASIDDVGIVALNDSTLQLTYENPSIVRLFNLATWTFFPVNKALVEREGVTYGSEASRVMFNGAFTIEEWRHEDRVVMAKNENYWNKSAIRLDKIINIVGITYTTAVDMMLAGELDVYVYNNLDHVNAVKDSGYTVEPIIRGYQFAHMNSSGSTRLTSRFMANTNFRRALNYAVNRQGLVASVYPGGQPTYRIAAPTMAGVNGLFVEEYPYEGWLGSGDPGRARQSLDAALRELGATIADVPELSLLCFESQASMTVMQAVQDMILSTLGLRSRIDPQPIQQMLAKAIGGDWDFWWGGKPFGSLDWGDGWARDYINDESNPYAFQYQNAEYTSKYYQMVYALTIQERKDLLFEMEKILCENPASILVAWNQNWVLLKEGIEGFVMGPVVNFTYLDVVK